MCSQRILIVEDNPVNQRVAELMLKRMGYVPVVVPNGKVALETLAHEYFPLILMDAQMPVMDGLTTTKWIRAHVAPEKQPKIVVMTASLMDEAKEMWKTTRVDGYVEKPVRLEVLHRTIDEILSGISDPSTSAL